MPFRPPIHQPHGSAAVRRKAHDQWRGSAASRGYDAAWRALRRAKLAADPLCWWCLREGILTPANTIDHIVPIVARPELRLMWGNLRSGCKRCHDAHTARATAAGHRGMRGKPGTGSRAGA